MSEDEENVEVNLTAELKAVHQAINAARLNFLNASTTFDQEDAKFAKVVRDQLERLSDPKRAPLIRKSAKEAQRAIGSFASLHANLASQVKTLLMASDLAALAASSKMLTGSNAAFQLPKHLHPRDAIQQQLEQLDAAKSEIAAIATQVIMLGYRTAEAIGAATRPIELRQATLQQAAHDLAPGKVTAPGAITAIAHNTAEAIVGEAKWKAFEEILKASALVATAHFPVVAIVVGIGRVASDVNARQNALRERNEAQRRYDEAHYQPGALDAMFNLPDQIRDEDTITASVIDLIRRVTNALNDAAKPKHTSDEAPKP